MLVEITPVGVESLELVEPVGIEPTTYWLQASRSPS